MSKLKREFMKSKSLIASESVFNLYFHNMCHFPYSRNQPLRVSAPHLQEAVTDRFLCPFPLSNNILLKEKGGNERVHFSSVPFSRSVVSDTATPWTSACQASLSTTNSESLLKLRSIESMMPSHHLMLCRPLLLLPSIFHSIRVFSKESTLRMRWPKYWSFSFSISPSSEHPGL